MHTVIIPIEESNSGGLPDIASSRYPREINFRKGAKYAVVLSSYGDVYTTHRTVQAAGRRAYRMRQFPLKVINTKGDVVAIHHRARTDTYHLVSNQKSHTLKRRGTP